MMQYHVIADDNDEILLSCLIGSDGEKDMTALEFKMIKSKGIPEQTLSWDNDNYLFGKFYKFLKRWRDKRLKKKDSKTFENIWHILDDEKVNELIEMLELALKEKWYTYE